MTSVARGRSPGGDWIRVGRGVHTRDPSLPGRLAAWAQLLRPTACFTHLTSAALRGWWLPPAPVGLPVWVMQISSQNAARRSGMRVIRSRYPPASELVAGLPTATAAETLVTCAMDVGVLDLVVMPDSALRLEHLTLEAAETVARQHRRGAPLLRQAIPFADVRSESPWESLLRVLHLSAGIDVEPQKEFFHDGQFVARADLWLVGTRTVHEYDGAYHREAEQHRQDLRRDRRLQAAGLVRHGYVATDVMRNPIGILRDADRAIGRPHDPRRLVPWLELQQDSLYTPTGMGRFCHRLGLVPPWLQKN